MTSQRTRDRLIARLREKGIENANVLTAMSEIPRHVFIDEALGGHAYEDTALPIGHAQTISQPYVVALMTSAILGGRPLQRVLEIGTGCGYQTAVLASLVEGTVYTVERLEPLLTPAKRRLIRLGYRNIRFKLADGTLGWPEESPYDAILATAAAPQLPEALRQQLADGGQLVIPLGAAGDLQCLHRITRTAEGFTDEQLEWVSFVPLVPGKV